MKPSEIFVSIASLGPVPHGMEDEVYGERLAGMGFKRMPGAWVLGEDRPIILAAHLDTVRGKAPTAIRISGWEATGVGGAMGADDKAGVALLLSLASEKYGEDEGVGYALFLGEEVGCLGAEEAHENDLFRGAKALISVDRRGTDEVIYAQSGGMTASYQAAEWLAKALGMGHKPSDRGVWTDSAVFAGVVPECLNLAAGYTGAHTDNDKQDLRYLEELKRAIVGVRWADMPVVREPKEVWRVGYGGYWNDWPIMREGGGRNVSVREVVSLLRAYGMVEEALEYLLETRPHLVGELVEELGLDEELGLEEGEWWR